MKGKQRVGTVTGLKVYKRDIENYNHFDQMNYTVFKWISIFLFVKKMGKLNKSDYRDVIKWFEEITIDFSRLEWDCDWGKKNSSLLMYNKVNCDGSTCNPDRGWATQIAASLKPTRTT